MLLVQETGKKCDRRYPSRDTTSFCDRRGTKMLPATHGEEKPLFEWRLVTTIGAYQRPVLEVDALGLQTDDIFD